MVKKLGSEITLHNYTSFEKVMKNKNFCQGGIVIDYWLNLKIKLTVRMKIIRRDDHETIPRSGSVHMQVCSFSAVLYHRSIAEVVGSSLKDIYPKIWTSEIKKAGFYSALP